MKAIVLTEFGGPEVLTYATVEDPHPGDNDVVVRVAASGVNFIDTYQRMGKYTVDFPFIPGFEGAGTVVTVGSGVTDFVAGDTVAWPMSLHSYAELVAVPAAKLVRVPDGIPLETAAATMLQGLTAHYLTRDVYPVGSGTVAVVHAAAGGTGLALTQVIKSLGGTVIGTVSTEEKAEKARAAGADHVIRYTDQDFVEETLSITAGLGAHVIYDGVGRDTVLRGLSALRRRGMMVYFGATSGPVDPLDLQVLSSRGSLVITKPTLSDFIVTPEETRTRAAEVFEMMAAGSLTIEPGHRFPLEQAAQAHAALEGRASSGKVLLLP